MARERLNEAAVDRLLHGVFPEAYDEKATDRQREKVDEVRAIAAGKNHTVIGDPMSAWNWLNALVEYADWEKKYRNGSEGRLNSIWLGSAADFKEKAYVTVRQLVPALQR
jgi:nitrogenase molybdenum-iron protein alpha/beta subunit